MFSSSVFMRNVFDWWLVIFGWLLSSLICTKMTSAILHDPRGLWEGQAKSSLAVFDQGITKKHREETGKDKTKHEGNGKLQIRKKQR